MRRFAQVLARDTDEADDLVQDALMAAWRHSPDREGSLRPWSATVVRKLFRMRLRADARRESREQEVEGPTYAPDPERELERLAVLKVLLSEIEALPADDQRILVRRFFAGEQAADIGRELDVPAATIRSRLHRSLKRLRDRLDERFDGRKTWCAAVLVAPPAVTTPASATTKGGSMIGTIYESVEIVESTFPDQAVLTCLTESMLGWVGEASTDSFERRPRITMVIGEPADEAEKERRQFEALAGAHVREIQFCEKKAPGSEGRMTLVWATGTPQAGRLRADSVTPTLSEVP